MNDKKTLLSDQAPHVSLVIPAYNEGNRIRDSLITIQDYLDQQSYNAEIIIVDDGSTDGTSTVAKEALRGLHSHRIVGYKQNRGKGYAIQKGIYEAKGKYLVFMDADLSTPIDELNSFLKSLERGSDIVIGTRKNKEAKVKKRQPFFRESLGKVFTLITNILLVDNISDITCGFKGFDRKVAQDLFGRQLIYNWSFDAEILFLAQKLRYTIKELPVTWYDAEGTKVRLSRDILGSLKGVFQIRLNYFFGRYDMKRGYSHDQK